MIASVLEMHVPLPPARDNVHNWVKWENAFPKDQVERCIALCDRLERQEIDVAGFLEHSRALLHEPALLAEIAPLITCALEECKDQVMFREQKGPRRITLQLLYLAPREVHPPHAHHNLISNQMTVHGRCHVREYDRVARLDDNTLLLRLARDAWSGQGDLMQTTETIRNAHWFAADDQPCVVLNFYILGYQSWTFDPKGQARRSGRQVFDPTRMSQEDGLIVAPQLEIEEGYRLFGGRALAEFAAIPPVGATPARQVAGA